MIWFTESSFYQHAWGLERGSFSLFLQLRMYTCNHIEHSMFRSWTLFKGNSLFKFALHVTSLGILECKLLSKQSECVDLSRLLLLYWGSDLLVWIVSTKALNCGHSCNFIMILNTAEIYKQMWLKLWLQGNLETPKTLTLQPKSRPRTIFFKEKR